MNKSGCLEAALWFGSVVGMLVLWRILGSGRAGLIIFIIGGLDLLFLAICIPYAIRKAREKQRAAAGLCPKCGYDIRATPARCPECGATFSLL